MVQKLVQSGRAAAVLGNHEINLLREDAKDGSGWFFDARVARDHEKYAPFQRPTSQERQDIVQFLSTLPIGLERAAQQASPSIYFEVISGGALWHAKTTFFSALARSAIVPWPTR